MIVISCPSGGCVEKVSNNTSKCMAIVYFLLSRLSANIWAGASLSLKPGGISRLRRAHHCQANQSKQTESPFEFPGGRLSRRVQNERKKTSRRSSVPLIHAVRHRNNRNPERMQVLFQFLPSSPCKPFERRH